MVKSKLMRQKWFPRPHDMGYGWSHGMETAVNNYYTMMPIVMQDEGLGAPISYNANPEHASFAAVGEPNCYPDSTVEDVITTLRFSLTKAALETDKIHAVRCMFMPVFAAFKEPYEATEDRTGATLSTVLELQKESTDRQAYPLFNGVKMTEKFTNSALLDSKVPGLTTTQVLEGITFSPGTYYNSIQYETIGGIVKKHSGGIKWFTLTRQRPVIEIRIKHRSSVKRMNPYTFFGVITGVPKIDNDDQIPISTETTNVSHVHVDFRCRYSEWNQGFDMDAI